MAESKKISNFIDKFRIRNHLAREILAEFIGTWILLVFGDGVVAQTVLSRGANGSALSINWAWGMAVVMGIYFAGGISGAHINPAVTVTMATIGRFPWKKVPFYIIAQFLGAFMAAACVFGVYHDAIQNYDGGERQVYGPNATAGIFATYPQDFLSVGSGFADQVFGTALLLACILAISDSRNGPPPPGMGALMVGLVVFVIGMTFGFNCGYAINPARDFGPRVFTAMAGYGQEVWFTRDGKHWWWVPILGPIVGGICGALMYIVFVEMHHEPEKVENGKRKRLENNHEETPMNDNKV
ncbi:putative aquaporin-9-like [Apostichopus japonicus]|uniref:Aquaporin-3 n=1 Tax=Stichopus japonicus TaxID=307972 RepID=A0A2G8L2F3_STIJA|nr:putative aquaporin-9-like [Apostichopus japonicus]